MINILFVIRFLFNCIFVADATLKRTESKSRTNKTKISYFCSSQEIKIKSRIRTRQELNRIEGIPQLELIDTSLK